MLIRAGAFSPLIRSREASWFDGQAAPTCLFMGAGFQHGSASAWRDWAL
jgi:hypothetical protein